MKEVIIKLAVSGLMVGVGSIIGTCGQALSRDAVNSTVFKEAIENVFKSKG